VAYGGEGRLAVIGGGAYFTFDHNTVFNDDGITILAYGPPIPGFAFTNNIIPDNSWAIVGDNTAAGMNTINRYFPDAPFLGGIFAGGDPSRYPAGNYYPSSMTAVGFVDLAGGNFRLSPQSPYRWRATDGTDVGCNIDALNAAAG